MSVIDKLNNIINCKNAIRNSINNKGGNLTESSKFSDYATAINNLTVGSGSGSSQVNIVKSIYAEQKDPIPNTGYLEKFSFNTKLEPAQVDSLIASANLTLVSIGDGVFAYPILYTNGVISIVILDYSSQLGVESGSSWIIADLIGSGDPYYVSPSIAPIAALPTGWNEATFTSFDTGEIAVGAELIPETQGIAVGAQNNLLTDLVRLYSRVDTGEVEILKTLTDQYKLVEQNITLDTKDNMNYTYDFANNINEDTKEISVIKNIKVKPSQEDAIILRSLTTYNNDRLTEIGSYAFYNCRELTDVNFQRATTVAEYAFFGCVALMNVNIPYLNIIGPKTFNNCYSLVKIFISQKDSICGIYIDTFDRCYHILGTTNSSYNPNGLKDGYIYVPTSLLSLYKVDQNWTPYASQIIGHEYLEAGATLPDYTISNFHTQTWYSDEKLTTVVTSVTTSGTYYCRLER